ncbi:hypothetical protein BJ508DRAFT_332629 [Ascobolus immersus RN42]|uniref:DNA-binding protein RAP1 n=1 Tax=Ascobolus immersus RN42 TaxID=1160509 RepID=A0A3N4HM46_ASCIM|nr:hypothetical protein BJ508DRAFT_332629 [Ascobolus immersus RN42]
MSGEPNKPAVFAGKRFSLSARVPSRQRFIDEIKEYGGIVTPLDKNADFKIADDLKDKNLVGNYISHKFITACIRKGHLLPPSPFRVGVPDDDSDSEGPPRRAMPKKKSQQTGTGRRARVPFSKADDLYLLNCLANNGSSANTAGNALYKEMAEDRPNHTMHSWRSRWYEHLKLIVPEEDLWGDNPCYGNNAVRDPPKELNVTRLKKTAAQEAESESEAGDVSRRSSGVRRQSGKGATLQRQRQMVRQQQNEEFEREALEEEVYGSQARRGTKTKRFSLQDDMELARLHSVIPTLPEPRRAAMFNKLAKKFPQHTAEEWQWRYNTHTVPEANKALLFLGDDEGEGQDTDHEMDYTQPEMHDTLEPHAPATGGGRQASPELGYEIPQPHSTFDESAIDPELLNSTVGTTFNQTANTTTFNQTVNTTAPTVPDTSVEQSLQPTNESSVQDVDSVARAFGHYRKIKNKAKAKRAMSSDPAAHTPERQIRHALPAPPRSPSGHGLKEVEQEAHKLSTPQAPFSPSVNEQVLERLRSSPVMQSPSLQRRRRQSTPQNQISSPIKKAPRSPKGHPVTSPPAPSPRAEVQITLTSATKTTKNVQQWLGDVSPSDSQLAQVSALAQATASPAPKKAVPAALLKYKTISKKRARADESTESIASSDQKRLRKDAAGTKSVTPAPVQTPTPTPAPAQQTITPPVTQSQGTRASPPQLRFQPPPPPQRTPEPVAPVAPMVAPTAPMLAPAPSTPAPRRSGRTRRGTTKEPTPAPAPVEEDIPMPDEPVEPAPAPAKRGRGRPAKPKRGAAVPPVPEGKSVKDMSTQDLYALADGMDQTGESLSLPVDQSTQRGNDTEMSFEFVEKEHLDTPMEEDEDALAEEDAEGYGDDSGDDDDEARALDEYIKTVTRWRDSYNVPEQTVLEVIVKCSKQEELILQCLESLKAGKGIPSIPGVWTEEDDRELQSGSAQAIEKMARKHGQENIDVRYEYLNSLNTFNSSKSRD